MHNLRVLYLFKILSNSIPVHSLSTCIAVRGTAAVALAALLGAMKLRDASSNLREQRGAVTNIPMKGRWVCLMVPGPSNHQKTI